MYEWKELEIADPVLWYNLVYSPKAIQSAERFSIIH
jgi:hypothetical protein